MIREIKKHCKEKGITFKKCNFYLNGNDAYRVDGKLYTLHELKEAYRHGNI